MGSRLINKTALVTGATSNIGRAIAVMFAAEGARLVVSGRDRVRGEEVVSEITKASGNAVFVAADLDGTVASSQALVNEAKSMLGGRVDILVNSAGIFPGNNTLTSDEALLDSVWAVNVKAPFFLVAAIAPEMVDNGGGAIINFGSWLARLGAPDACAYNATKGAIETLTRDWAAAFGPGGVRVNCISPGAVRNPIFGGAPEGAETAMRGTPVGRSLPPEAIASAAVYLASDEALYVHGSLFDIDGGRANIAVFQED